MAKKTSGKRKRVTSKYFEADKQSKKDTTVSVGSFQKFPGTTTQDAVDPSLSLSPSDAIPSNLNTNSNGASDDQPQSLPINLIDGEFPDQDDTQEMEDLDQFILSKSKPNDAKTNDKIEPPKVNDKDDEQASKTAQNSTSKRLLLDFPNDDEPPIVDNKTNNDTLAPNPNANTNATNSIPSIQISPVDVDNLNFAKPDAVSPQLTKTIQNKVDVSPKGAISNLQKDAINPSKKFSDKSEISAEDQFLNGHFAHPTSIPSLLTKQVAFTGMKLSVLVPHNSGCVYCLKLEEGLYPFPFPEETSNWDLAKESLFCKGCVNHCLVKLRARVPSILDVEIPLPKLVSRRVPFRKLTKEEVYQFNEKYGALMFWDPLGTEILKKMKQKDVVTFLKWKNEWTKHLQQNRVRPWADPKALSTFVPDQDAQAQLAQHLLINKKDIIEYILLLEKKRQIAFYGPPGTGKTLVAQEIAEFCIKYKAPTPGKGSISVVQFHPTYSYEDFVEGYRPIITNSANSNSVDGKSSMIFQVTSGPLKQIAEEATKNPDGLYVLIIDELNRGNVAKIFGELLYLFEYRGKAIRLQYSNIEFALPHNLWFIATMNTFDRSLARLDRALRRRFFFIPFVLDKEPVKGLLLRWLEKFKPDMVFVDKMVRRANEILTEHEETMTIGPSHFMTMELDFSWLKMIWKYSIVPEAEEWIQDAEKLQEFVNLPESFKPDSIIPHHEE